MASTPRMHSRRDANSPAGVPHSYVPLSDGTHGRHRTGAPALATIGTLKRPLIFLFLALTLLFALTACATADNPSRGERASAGAPLALLPDDTTRLEVLTVSAIVGGGVPEALENWFDDEWERFALGDDILTGEDIGTLVHAVTRDGRILLMSGGQIDFAGIRDWLDDEEANIGKTSYQGRDMWGDESDTGKAMVVLESDGHVAYGDTSAIKELLKVKARGTGSLNQAPENSLKQAFDDARAGWYVLASENCDEFSSDLRSCEAYSVSAGQGEEDYLVDLSYRFLFRSEQRAESQALDIEDWLDDTGWDIDLEEVKADGVSVEARASGDEEDFRLVWLGNYYGIGRPSPLPTAMPEPESRETTGTTTGTASGQPLAAPTATSRANRSTATTAPTPTAAPTTPTAAPLGEAVVEWVSDCSREFRTEGLAYDTWDYDCHTAGETYDHHRFYTFTLASPRIVVIQVEASRSDFEVGLFEADDPDKFKQMHNEFSAGDNIVVQKFDLPRGEHGIRVASPGIGTFELGLILIDN